MKRYRIFPHANGSSELRFESDLPDPVPGAGEVLVSMRAASLNYRDLLIRSGKSASGGEGPLVPLSDGAGEIAAVGSGVSGWEPGDRVALTFFRDWESGPFDMRYHEAARGGSCDGVLSDQVVTPARGLVRIPDYLSFEEAATLPCAALTSWHAMMERGKRVGGTSTVLCLGTGGVSIFSLQIARAAGARVIVTSSSDEKLERAVSELGADETINYRETPEWDREIFARTGNRGVDQVIEVGGPGTLARSMNAVAAGGDIALIGVLTGFESPDASLFPLVARNVELSGIYVGSRGMFERMVEFFETHAIRPVVDAVFGWDEAADAYEYLESGKHFGKIVLRIDSEGADLASQGSLASRITAIS